MADNKEIRPSAMDLVSEVRAWVGNREDKSKSFVRRLGVEEFIRYNFTPEELEISAENGWEPIVEIKTDEQGRDYFSIKRENPINPDKEEVSPYRFYDFEVTGISTKKNLSMEYIAHMIHAFGEEYTAKLKEFFKKKENPEAPYDIDARIGELKNRAAYLYGELSLEEFNKTIGKLKK